MGAGEITGVDWLNAGSNVLSSMMGGKPAAATSGATLDGSGFTVATGASKATGGSFNVPWWAWAGAIAGGLIWLIKTR